LLIFNGQNSIVSYFYTPATKLTNPR